MSTKEEDQSEPQFRFNKYQATFHIVFAGAIAISFLYIVNDEADAGNSTKTVPSFLTPYIGRQRDAHDLQWNTFRANLLILISVIMIWYWVSGWLQAYKNQKSWLLGLLFLLYSYRSDLFIFAGIVGCWYIFCRNCKGWRYFVPACWIICIITLFINERTHHFADLSLAIGENMPFEFLGSRGKPLSCGQNLNMTFLKLLSFAIDLKRGDESRELQKHLSDCSECTARQYCLKGRNFVQPDNYGFLNFVNYLLFTPTFLAGPPTSFKNFLSFKSMPSSKRPEILRCVVLLATFELFQHYAPEVNLSEEQSLLRIISITLMRLMFFWYKLLVIWKIHKAWAQLYGVEVVDNMNRCVFNTYSFEGLWRMWHRGFNQWLIRYLYIPLGGRTNYWSVIASVAFVAFWHDHKITIVIWALIIMLFLVPQISIRRYFYKNYRHLYQQYWFKYVCALVGALNICVIVLANVIGFTDTTKLILLWQKMKVQWLGVCWSLLVGTCGVMVMFYKRYTENGKFNY